MVAGYTAAKVFSATKAKERSELGDYLTEWLVSCAGTVEIVDTVVRQSSDRQFHCLSIIVFYRTITPEG